MGILGAFAVKKPVRENEARIMGSANSKLIMRFLPVIVLLFLAGCTTVQPFSANSPEGRAEINSRGSDRVALVVFESGRTVHAHSLRIEGDSLSWITADQAQVDQAAVSEIRAISFPSRRGYLRNTGIGFALGAGLGYGMVLLSENSDAMLGRPTAGVLLTGLLGLWGAGIGLTAAIDQADMKTYRVEDSGE